MQRPVPWCLEALPAPPGLSFYLGLPGTAKRTTNHLSLSRRQPNSHHPGLPTKAQVRLQVGVGRVLLMPRWLQLP